MSARLTAKVYSLLLISLVSFACNNQQNGQQHQHKDTISPVRRDTSVTKLNSYVDFFLDSAQLASYLRTEPLADSLRQSILNFYKERNYEFAWLGSDGITDHARGFWNLYLQSPFSRIKTSNDTLIDAVIEQAEQESMDSFSGIDSLRKLELALTTRFFVYSEKIYGSHTDPRQLEWHIPERKFNVSSLLHQFLSTEPTAWFPVSHTFSALRTGLRTYREVQREGGWGKIAWP
ncbi:MAG TPA: hypothetical protein VL307_03010, partial [Chitinophagaceae bacterium]|nr:hypothetical protein [Chitinophagaceae bacterium]